MPTSSAPDQAAVYQRPADLLQHFIRFDTTNPPGNEAECVAYIDHLLTLAGFDTTLLARDPTRPNLIARLPGRGEVPPLLLYGHVDVVTTENQAWQYPPFEGRVVNGYVWGRGALDCKGGVAMLLAAFLRAKAKGLKPPGDALLAIVCDEETGGEYGTKYLVENHAALFAGIRYAIGEFGGYTFYIGRQKFYPMMVAEKQPCVIKATVRGPGGHASSTRRGGATAKLARLLQRLDASRLPVHITPAVRLMFETGASALPFPTNIVLPQLLKPALTDRVLDLLGARGRVFEPLLHNTVNVTAVHGGEQLWGIPAEIVVQLAASLLPGYGPDDVISELRHLIGGDVELEVIYRTEPGPAQPDMGLFDTLSNILQEVDPDGIPVPLLLSGTTDGRLFSRLGIQTYGFLPMQLPKDFNFSRTIHAADERIPIGAVDFGANAIYKLLQRFGG